jgi:hypothetical protein
MPGRDLAALPFLALPFLLAAASCAPRMPPAPDPIAPAALNPDVRIEQSLWLKAGGRAFLGRGVVVKRGSRLDLLVLAPTGNRLLTVRNDDGIVTSEARAPGLERLNPRFLLADVRWAFFAGCDPTAVAATGAPATASLERTCTFGGTTVREVDDPATGDLRHREVSWGGLTARLDFLQWAGEGADRHPVKVRLENERLGYEWEVQVDAWKRLE